MKKKKTNIYPLSQNSMVFDYGQKDRGILYYKDNKTDRGFIDFISPSEKITSRVDDRANVSTSFMVFQLFTKNYNIVFQADGTMMVVS